MMTFLRSSPTMTFRFLAITIFGSLFTSGCLDYKESVESNLEQLEENNSLNVTNAGDNPTPAPSVEVVYDPAASTVDSINSARGVVTDTSSEAVVLTLEEAGELDLNRMRAKVLEETGAKCTINTCNWGSVEECRVVGRPYPCIISSFDDFNKLNAWQREKELQQQLLSCEKRFGTNAGCKKTDFMDLCIQSHQADLPGGGCFVPQGYSIINSGSFYGLILNDPGPGD